MTFTQERHDLSLSLSLFFFFLCPENKSCSVILDFVKAKKLCRWQTSKNRTRVVTPAAPLRIFRAVKALKPGVSQSVSTALHASTTQLGITWSSARPLQSSAASFAFDHDEPDERETWPYQIMSPVHHTLVLFRLVCHLRVCLPSQAV